jgi:hypothetical protein
MRDAKIGLGLQHRARRISGVAVGASPSADDHWGFSVQVEYAIDTENGIVKTHFRGVITPRELSDFALGLAKHPGFRPDFHELATFAEDCDPRLSFIDFQALSHLDPFSRTSRRALVIPSRGALYGVARMVQTASNNNPNVRIVDSTEDALRWLIEVHSNSN